MPSTTLCTSYHHNSGRIHKGKKEENRWETGKKGKNSKANPVRKGTNTSSSPRKSPLLLKETLRSTSTRLKR